MPNLSVVLPCAAGHAEVLARCLESLRAQQHSGPFEIFVVNSNDSATVANVAKSFDAHVVAAGGASTAGMARNIGAAASDAELLAFIDADCTADPGWLGAIQDAMNAGAKAVGGPVLNQLPLHPVAVIDNLMQFVDQAPRRPPGRARELPGCNMAIRRDAFDAIGGFPEDVYPGEDTIFSQQASHQWPERVRYSPAARIHHRGRTSIREFMRHQYDFGFGRGRYALNVSSRQQSLGRRIPFAVLAGLRRLAYFFLRTAQWNILSLPRLVVFSPVLLIGLASWTRGFRRGCLYRHDQRGE